MLRREAGSIGVDQRPRRVVAGPPSRESFKGKLDPRIVRFAVGTTLVALGVISLALPTIDTAANIDVLTHPPYSPAPTEQAKLAVIQTVETTRTKAEPTKSAATSTEIVNPKSSPAAPKFAQGDYSCNYKRWNNVDNCPAIPPSYEIDYCSSSDQNRACSNGPAGGDSSKFVCTPCSAGCNADTYLCNLTPTLPRSVTPTGQPKP